MPISRIPGVGLDTGSSGVAPSNLSTGGPSWDGSGNVTVSGRLKAAQPYAFVSKNNGNISAGNVIIFNVVNSDSSSMYNSTTGRFTAPVAGRYLFNHGLFSNSGSSAWVAWRINGVDKATTYTTASGYGSIAGSFICDMQAGDYADLYVKTGAAYVVYGSDVLQCWSQFMLLS
jgi:hypothetical protein